MSMVATLESYKALKLDAAFRPVAIVSSTEALVNSMLGRVIVLETYDRSISSARQSFKLPSVIMLRRVMKKYTGQLPCCSKYIFVRDTGKCQYCGVSLTRAASTLDHVVPKSKGGGYSWQNLVTACKKCNQQKGNRLLHETNLCLLKTPKPLTYERYLKLTGECEGPWQDYMS
jgi:5-methylcytosine-specific restriction endonuclease McrA